MMTCQKVSAITDKFLQQWAKRSHQLPKDGEVSEINETVLQPWTKNERDEVAEGLEPP